jgi:DNA-binding NtrC family response regulator
VSLRLLIVDDEEPVRRLLLSAAGNWGHHAAAAPNPAEALKLLAAEEFDAVITDLQMPGMDGMEFIRKLRAERPDVNAVVLTSHGDVAKAVEAMRAGAYDFLIKFPSLPALEALLSRLAQLAALRAENRRLREELAGQLATGARPLLGRSPAMLRVAETVGLVAANRSNVLIVGESGTGKEVVARAIHARSGQPQAPFLGLNCASFSRTLLESQLFGHLKGSFTGAIEDRPGFFVAAGEGTLFLDEVTEVDAELQPRLLRALQEREVIPVGGTAAVKVRARVISATGRDPAAAIREGRLREDLYYRLNVVRIDLPPLRERREDIPLLVEYFNQKFSRVYGVAPKKVSAEVLAVLSACDWPGNVRQLENAVEHAFALGERAEITMESLPPEVRGGSGGTGAGSGQRAAPAAAITLGAAERDALVRAMDAAGGNKSLAAKLLDIPRNRLYRLLKQHNID